VNNFNTFLQKQQFEIRTISSPIYTNTLVNI